MVGHRLTGNLSDLFITDAKLYIDAWTQAIAFCGGFGIAIKMVIVCKSVTDHLIIEPIEISAVNGSSPIVKKLHYHPTLDTKPCIPLNIFIILRGRLRRKIIFIT